MACRVQGVWQCLAVPQAEGEAGLVGAATMAGVVVAGDGRGMAGATAVEVHWSRAHEATVAG